LERGAATAYSLTSSPPSFWNKVAAGAETERNSKQRIRGLGRRNPGRWYWAVWGCTKRKVFVLGEKGGVGEVLKPLREEESLGGSSRRTLVST